MKKILQTTTTLVAILVTTSAFAQIELGLAGYFRGYAVYSKDETAGMDLREFDLRRDAEIHFTSETTLDNGLTVGVHHEIIMADNTFGNSTNESYLYFSGSWGRVNLGAEDGAAYLLQVAAPSADSNIDGLRPQISTTGVLTYEHAYARNADRITYLTPKFSGFQAGFSYAPEWGMNAIGNNVAPMATADDPNDIEHLWEAALRWDGEFQGFGLSLGAGYSDVSIEEPNVITDGTKIWNVGANVTAGAFSAGAAYRKIQNETFGLDISIETKVAGVAWDEGLYHLGASYMDTDADIFGDYEVFTFGGGYAFGPGMSLRGAIMLGESSIALSPEDIRQVTIGTDIEF